MKTVSSKQPNAPRRRRVWQWRRGGFTVVELLVTVLLIAILFLLAVPVGQRMRIISLQTSSLNNIREVSRGLLAWILEANHGRFPYAYVNPNAGSYPVGTNMELLPKHYVYWAGAVYKGGYVGRVEQFFSPLQKERYWLEPTFYSRLRADKNAWQWGMIGYGANGVLMPYSSDARAQPTSALASLQDSGAVILLAEAKPNPSQSSGGRYDGFHAVRPRKMTYPLAVRAMDKATVSFADGHAAMVKSADLGWDAAEEKWKGDLNDLVPPWAGRP